MNAKSATRMSGNIRDPPLISPDTKVLILILSNILLDMRCRKNTPVAQQLSKRGFVKGGTKPEPYSLLAVLLQRKFIVLIMMNSCQIVFNARHHQCM